MPIVEFDPEEGVGERFDNRTLNLDGTVFLGHILRASLLVFVLFCSCLWPALLSRHRLAAPSASAAAKTQTAGETQPQGLLPRQQTNARASVLGQVTK